MVRVYVNEVEVEVPPGTTVLQAIRKAGFTVPTLCYLEGFFTEATCRLCIVQVNGRVVPSCTFPVSDGIKVVTESEELRRYRRLNLELILATHRLACWSCLRKSSCSLLSIAAQLGIEGIPVCSECPLIGSSCLVFKGQPCLGPLTVAGCSAECPRSGTPCIGCRGYLTRREVWEDAITDLYEKNWIRREELAIAVSLFWSTLPDDLKKVLLGART